MAPKASSGLSVPPKQARLCNYLHEMGFPSACVGQSSNKFIIYYEICQGNKKQECIFFVSGEEGGLVLSGAGCLENELGEEGEEGHRGRRPGRHPTSPAQCPPGRGPCFSGATADPRLREGNTAPAERLQSCERGVSVQGCRLSQEGRVSGGVSVQDSTLLFR